VTELQEVEKDPLDEELSWVVPMVCMEEGCSRMFCPSGFDRPFTPRKVIHSLAQVGWQWIESEDSPTKGKVYCKLHVK